MENIKKGNYFRTYSGFIGEVENIININGTKIIESSVRQTGQVFHIPVENVKKCEKKLIKLFEYEDLLKVFNKELNGYFYYGFSENKVSTIDKMVAGLTSTDNYEIVGIISRESLKLDFFNIQKQVCGLIEEETCQCEKMGCKGCFYNVE